MAVPQQTIQQAVGQPMAQEPPPVAPQAQPLATTGPMDPQSAIKALTGESLAIDFASQDVIERITAYQNWPGKDLFNVPLLDTYLSVDAPPGVSVMLLSVVPKLDDAWHGDDARKMKLKDGHVEPKAQFIERLQQMMGIKIFKTDSSVNDETGAIQYEELYTAYLMLPNGEIMSVEGEGKAQDMYTTQGTRQAHLKESTRKKAKRNAIKALLQVPTSMPESEFLKPWIVPRVVVKGGHPEADAILSRQKSLADEALKMLYSGATLELPSGTDAETLIKGAEEAQDVDALRLIGQQYRAGRYTDNEATRIRAAINRRNQELTQGGGAQGANPA